VPRSVKASPGAPRIAGLATLPLARRAGRARSNAPITVKSRFSGRAGRGVTGGLLNSRHRAGHRGRVRARGARREMPAWVTPSGSVWMGSEARLGCTWLAPRPRALVRSPSRWSATTDPEKANGCHREPAPGSAVTNDSSPSKTTKKSAAKKNTYQKNLPKTLEVRTMVEIKQELRHYCRSPKCRSKLPAPVVCGKRKCRNALKANTCFGRYHAPSSVVSSLKTSTKPGIKSGAIDHGVSSPVRN
jgi:hypothetical protein